MYKRCIFTLIILCITGSALAQRTVYVDGSVATTGDGSLEAPFKTIDEGLNLQDADLTVLVAGGTYTNEPQYNNISNGQTLIGSYDSSFTTSDPLMTPTIIDMGRVPVQQQHGTFYIRAIPFTIENIIIQNSTTGISDDTEQGGAIYIRNGSNGTIRGVTFFNCAGLFEGGVSTGAERGGGAVSIRDDSTVVFEDCIFDSCVTVNTGGAVNFKSGNNNAKFDRCMFTNCGARDGGSTIYNGSGGNQVEIVNCVFLNNGVDVVVPSGTYPSQYTIGLADRKALIYNCTFVGNNNPDGYMIYLRNSSNSAAVKEIINCVIANNTIADDGSIIEYEDGYDDTTTLQNNLFFSNSGLDPLDPAGATIIDTNGNITGDPQFADAENGDYHLKAGSPGEDAGQTLARVIDDFTGTARPIGAAYDMGAFEGQLMYKVQSVIATASSLAHDDLGPENTVDESGLNPLDQHDTNPLNMWLSGLGQEQPVWIQYEFDKIYKLDKMWVWNSNSQNEMIPGLGGLGVKTATIAYSTDNITWDVLPDVPEFNQATGTDDYPHNTTVDFNGVAAKFVKITCTSSWGGQNQYGLSEVRFLYFPVYAQQPSPRNGATGVALDTILSWLPGTEAAEHKVYFSDDEQSVIDGTAPVETVSQTTYNPLSLDLATTYYWRVDEVNNVNAVPTWEGNVWNFTTQDYIVVDDFEDYNDYEPDEIWRTWIDGYGVPSNGSSAGYPDPDFVRGEHYVETSIVHSDKQSMPLLYDNTGGVNNSEVTRTFGTAQDWTRLGTNTLTLYVYGQADNVGGQLYVKVNGIEKAVDVDLTSENWQRVNIELGSFGANLQQVTSMAISIQGDGSGTVFIDDIRLYLTLE